MDCTQKFVRSPDVIQVQVDQRPILLHATKWEYLAFDAVGGVIWEMMAEPRSLDSLVGSLLDHYQVDRETCGRDTEIFLDKLIRENFLTAQA